MNFGERLYNIRKEKKITQEQLSEKINVSRQAISKWENGEAVPDMNKLVLMASALDMSIDNLCGIENKKDVIDNSKPVNNSRFINVFVALICLCLGLMLGLGLKNGKEDIIDLPESISVSVYDISRIKEDDLMLYFIPSAGSKNYQYKITCYGTNKEVFEFPARYEKGMVSCEFNLPENVPFLVVGTVSEGVQERNFLITQGLVNNASIQSYE